MSTAPRKTAAVALDWSTDSATIVEIEHPLRPERIIDLISATPNEHWAVDFPSGWPDLFVALMADDTAPH